MFLIVETILTSPLPRFNDNALSMLLRFGNCGFSKYFTIDYLRKWSIGSHVSFDDGCPFHCIRYIVSPTLAVTWFRSELALWSRMCEVGAYAFSSFLPSFFVELFAYGMTS